MLELPRAPGLHHLAAHPLKPTDHRHGQRHHAIILVRSSRLDRAAFALHRTHLLKRCHRPDDQRTVVGGRLQLVHHGLLLLLASFPHPGSAGRHAIGPGIDVVAHVPKDITQALLLHLGGVIGHLDLGLGVSDLLPDRFARAVQFHHQVDLGAIAGIPRRDAQYDVRKLVGGDQWPGVFGHLLKSVSVAAADLDG